MKRSHTCGELRLSDVGTEVCLMGWVNSWRDHGGLIFIDLRDRYGVTQVVFNPSDQKELHARANRLRSEFVILIEGEVMRRPEGTRNAQLPTGEIEVNARQLEILNTSLTPPFEIINDIELNEELRLQYRYLDIRRSKVRSGLILRSQVYKIVSDFFHGENFVEIETPILMKSTPEGARDYLVPSRNYPGKFYALPQSPQTYKQILMIAGLDRYYQIVRCFRDEDLRKDRQPEFTQIDVEMSFVSEDDVIDISERLIEKIWREARGIEVKRPFRRMTYDDAIRTYGSDKPDLRYGMEIGTFSDIFGSSEFRVFSDTLKQGGVIAGLCCPEGNSFTRKKIDQLTDHVKSLGAKGLVWMRLGEEGLEGPAVKFLAADEKKDLVNRSGVRAGMILFLVSGPDPETYMVLGDLRRRTAAELNLIGDQDRFLWIVDFPMLEYDQEEQRYVARHHPFTAPQPRFLDDLETDPVNVRARAYDLVINGYEIAGGSIRIHDSAIQRRVFDMLKIGEEEAANKFGFLLKALNYGAPPHGGIAFGFDHMMMLLAGTQSIRDVIAFPKTSSGLSLMDGAPTEVDQKQLLELGLRLK